MILFFHFHGIFPHAEVISDARGREVPTGTKRNDLIAQAKGEYFCFVDDDDQVNDLYVTKILAAIAQAPDVVTFQGWMTTNGQHRVDWTIKLGEAYEERNGHYYRWPNHLCVFKKSLVQHIKFPDIWHGEDYKWSVAVRDSGVLKTEVHIPEQLYWYDYKTK
jgi:glycosyltransferase involved in cell wall biosynthesis